MAEEKKQIKLTEDQLLNAFANERSNMEAMQASLSNAENNMREIFAATDALNTIKKAKENEKIIVPLGSGIFIDASLESNQNAKSSLAGGVVVNVAIEEALKQLLERKQETEKTIGEMHKELERISTNLNSIGSMIRTIEHKKSEQGKQQ